MVDRTRVMTTTSASKPDSSRPTVFIHTNDRQMLGALVSQYSMRRNATDPDAFDVHLIVRNDFPWFDEYEGRENLRDGASRVWRNDDLQSFTPLRFMPPELMGYAGRAVVTDPDVFAVGDVMELLEDMDALLDRFTGLIWQFEIERPDICAEFHESFRELLQYSVEAVEATVRSCRAFFKDIHTVADHIHKVSFWEKESDKVSTRLQRAIFGHGNLHLSHKMHLRFFAKQVDRIADEAEDVADRLNIYVIKRML